MIRIFPNRESLQRLMDTLLMDIHEGWPTGRHYLSPSYIQKTLNPAEAAHPNGYLAAPEETA